MEFNLARVSNAHHLLAEGESRYTRPDHSFVRSELERSPSPGSESLLRAVEAISDREAWAVGTVQAPSYDNLTLIVHYLNGAWTVIPSPSPDASCTDGNVVYGGNRLNALGHTEEDLDAGTLVEHWNGSSWSVVSSPRPGTEHRSIPESGRILRSQRHRARTFRRGLGSGL